MTTTTVIHPHVESRADVQGGRPVIKSTRFPVSSIVQNYRRGLSVEEILSEFPHLTDVEQTLRQFPPTLRPGQ